MDTDDLTPMAYETIIKAEEVLDVLRSEIGASASHKKNEDDFLRGVKAHLRRVLRSAREYTVIFRLDKLGGRKLYFRSVSLRDKKVSLSVTIGSSIQGRRQGFI